MQNPTKKNSIIFRKKRVRAKISGSSTCPRLSVFRSLKNIYAQVIDDQAGKTIVSASMKETKSKNGIEGARLVGKLVAEKCAKANISNVVFDRSGYKYHGKVKALAEGAREGGLNF